MKRSTVVLSAALLSLGCLLALPARAGGGVQWSVGISNAPYGVGVTVGNVLSGPAPVYVPPPGVVYTPPPPVYVSPPPLYVPRPPAYVAPPPIYVAPPPVHTAPPPVYYVPSAPRFLPPPPVAYVPVAPAGWRGHHHGGYWRR
ncbi:hypothetical protein [uncultured Azohydromonas sp.]|jgi:hypothetical protein|uniref:hypothetical protein n=1 Tax=uncultured Azohydromonas sp. TaxID=487342 RepID=UPI00262BC0F1|nr:hypothetical protein [uncultured Azohydromonas sp.]